MSQIARHNLNSNTRRQRRQPVEPDRTPPVPFPQPQLGRATARQLRDDPELNPCHDHRHGAAGLRHPGDPALRQGRPDQRRADGATPVVPQPDPAAVELRDSPARGCSRQRPPAARLRASRWLNRRPPRPSSHPTPFSCDSSQSAGKIILCHRLGPSTALNPQRFAASRRSGATRRPLPGGISPTQACQLLASGPRPYMNPAGQRTAGFSEVGEALRSQGPPGLR